MNRLLELCYKNQYNTDKFYRVHGTGWMGNGHCYVENVYFKHFERNSLTAKSLLEIGNYCGGSALLWKDYLPEAKVFTVDLNYVDQLKDESRIVQIVGDAYSNSFVDILKDQYFDYIIDDGSHQPDHQRFFIQHYLSKLKDDGVLVIEDISNRELADSLFELIPQEDKKYAALYDLRHLNNRYDDIAIVIDRGNHG